MIVSNITNSTNINYSQHLSPVDMAWDEVLKSPHANGNSLVNLKAKYVYPIYAAIAFDDVQLCEKLLNIIFPSKTKLCDADPANKLLYLAVVQNNVPIAKLLLDRGANCNQIEDFAKKNYEIPVVRAFGEKKVDMMKAFIDKGFQIDRLLLETIPFAFFGENRVESMKLALQLGANIHHQFPDGKPYLYFAAIHGDLDLCRFLIDAGADIKAVDHKNQNVLRAAKGHPELIPFLIEKGTNVQSIDEQGSTLLEIYEETKNSEALDALKRADQGWTPFIKRMRLMGLRFSLKGIILEGSKSNFAYKELAHSFEGYLNTIQGHTSSTKAIKESIENATTLTCDEILKRLEKNETVTLSCGWPKHETVAVFNNQNMILGNRGDGSDNKSGFTFYQINKPENLKEAIENLFKKKSPFKEDELFDAEKCRIKQQEGKEFFNDKLLKLLDLKEIKHFNQKEQTSGNCTWMAAKMGLMGNLVLEQMKEHPEKNINDIFKEAKVIYREWKNYDNNLDIEILKQAEQFPKIKEYIDIEKIYDELFTLNFCNDKVLAQLCAMRPRLEKWRTNPDPSLISYAMLHKKAKLMKKLMEIEGIPIESFSSSDQSKFNKAAYTLMYYRAIKGQPTIFHNVCTTIYDPSVFLTIFEIWKEKANILNQKDILKNAINARCEDKYGGFTPLIGLIASCKDLASYHQAIKVMLELGSDPCGVNKEQDTALHYAVIRVGKKEDVEVVKTLIQAAGNAKELVNRANVNGLKPLDIVPPNKDFSDSLLQVLMDTGEERTLTI